MRQMGVPEHMRHQQRSSQDELALRHIFGRALMGRMVGGVRGLSSGVDHADIAEQKHALPWHQHVVEEDHRVHLLEA